MIENHQYFGAVAIFRPAFEIEAVIREQARAHLFSRFTAGKYTGAEANALIQHQFGVYSRILDNVLPVLERRAAVDFLLTQYDQACRLLHGKDILDLEERRRWSEIEPLFKRAIKYLMERICMAGRLDVRKVDKREAQVAMHMAVSCAEQMAHLAMESDLVSCVFHEDVQVEVFDSGHIDYHIGTIGRHAGYSERFYERLKRDRNSRNDTIASPHFNIHTAKHQHYLDAAFTKAHGLSYGQFVKVLMTVIDGCTPSLHPMATPALFVHRQSVVDQLYKTSGTDAKIIERILDGFTLTPGNLHEEGRQIFKPKQTHRALRRGFFLLPHETGPHLAFSRSMAQENLVLLIHTVSYQKLPPEWVTEETNRALQSLSLAAGKWFEQQLAANMQKLGIHGGSASRWIGMRQDRVAIPPEIGEIDFIGIEPSQGSLVVLEAKMVRDGLEAAFWRDEMDDFLKKKRNYADQFRRKRRWVLENRAAISRALGYDGNTVVVGALVTFYPSIVKEFLDDVPCHSLTELVLDYRKAGKWPYESLDH